MPQLMPTLDDGKVWVPDAWTVWTLAGVRYWRAHGALYAQDDDGRYQWCVDRAGVWLRVRRSAAVAIRRQESRAS